MESDTIDSLEDQLLSLKKECDELAAIPAALETMWVDHIQRSEECQKLMSEQQEFISAEEYAKAGECDLKISELDMDKYQAEITRSVESLGRHDELLDKAQELYNQIQAEKTERIKTRDWDAAEKLKEFSKVMTGMASGLANCNNADEVLRTAQQLHAQQQEDSLTEAYKKQLAEEQATARERTQQELQSMEAKAEARRDADVERKVKLYQGISAQAQKLPTLPAKLAALVQELEPIKTQKRRLASEKAQAAMAMEFREAEKIGEQLAAINLKVNCVLVTTSSASSLLCRVPYYGTLTTRPW